MIVIGRRGMRTVMLGMIGGADLRQNLDDARGLHRTERKLEATIADRSHKADGHQRMHHQQRQQPHEETLMKPARHKVNPP
jgi:hypothetical protein